MGAMKLLPVLFAVAAAAPNEVGLSLAKAFGTSASSLEAKAEVARMTGELMVKQKQLAAAKLRVEQLTSQERSFSVRAESLSEQESRMEEKATMNGGATSHQAILAKAEAQAQQQQMLKGQAEAKSLQEEIKGKSELLKSSEEQLRRVKRKEEDYSNGARLAVSKSNKLERDLNEARIELEKEKASLTEQTEKAEVAEADRDSTRRILEKEEAENAAESEWLAAHRGHLKSISETNISMAQQEFESAKQMLKDARRKTKEQAAADAETLNTQRGLFHTWQAASAEALRQAETQLEAAKKEQQQASQSASHLRSTAADAFAVERMAKAQEGLKPLSSKLERDEERLRQQQHQNQESFQAISKKRSELETEALKEKSALKSESELEVREMERVKKDAQEVWQQDRAKETDMERTINKMRSDQDHEKHQVVETDSKLKVAKRRLQKAQLKLEMAEKEAAQGQLDYEKMMYEANSKAEEKAQKEVEKLQKEFQEVHADKSSKITELNHKLDDLKKAKLRGA